LAYGEAKRLVVDSLSNGLETQMELETRAISGLARASKDTQEGIAAFVGKRSPDFKGH
jgi:2-(1,2-epoxy-1,2-dihydrophenyl)acetyl-CoA isomerase